ncbi:aminotransferase class V-fold PLP-dependent enzyme [Aureisphaera galaxeae]|uniref:aminotransferase class V-fold PLP-dependent enzyme n=1 Tax=Aureisphaera galaxeae TaxID=1538023 RepID=UPI002350E8F0|nr:aminotransferase class V-fold PLP-dependent enzyme [Aureisphaera galaxeae]MDC8004612.1 aminotransferase class V-fold PLP-dependent enzyme [Aureisphaera galaxeae]
MLTRLPDKVDNLEIYFNSFRSNIVGIDHFFTTPFGEKKIIYTDWTASGRLYRPIEEKILNEFGPFVANTHTETTVSGTAMTYAYREARKIIKEHVNASADDVLITTGTGMTGAVNKFQRILGLKVPEQIKDTLQIREEDRPIVFVSHMEHHSNQTSWLETLAKVVVIPCNHEGLFCLENFKALIEEYKDKPNLKIASITSCSNVTGITTPYYEVARLMHEIGGLCFVDFACSGPYVDINMHPEDPESYLDAIFFSPHKFLGGPGSSGVLIFNKKLYRNLVPDCPGGGTVSWTTPWGQHKYVDDIEEREDGGTPGFLQVIRTSLAITLKEQMGVEAIMKREHELLTYFFDRISGHKEISILAGEHRDRLGVVSLNIGELHFDLAVKMLNDRYGIQTRGGCSCAGTYGHYLLEIDQTKSNAIISEIESGKVYLKPGWVRISFHPTMTNAEMAYVCDSLLELASHWTKWKEDYKYQDGKFLHKNATEDCTSAVSKDWFKL